MILTAKGFNILRNDLFGKLDESQVKALNFIVERCDHYGLTCPRTAYVLATIYHETGYVTSGKMYRSMQPIKERGSDAYLRSKKYWPYIGYGYVQLTWEENYRRIGKLIGADLIKRPELALEPDIAIEIAIKGMSLGWFTGLGFNRKRDVNKYDVQSYIKARGIINGTDRAADVASYAMIFEKALRAA